MTTSELSAQLQIARKLLVETSNALKEERLKVCLPQTDLLFVHLLLEYFIHCSIIVCIHCMKVAGSKSASKSKETRDATSQENTASQEGNCEL